MACPRHKKKLPHNDVNNVQLGFNDDRQDERRWARERRDRRANFNDNFNKTKKRRITTARDFRNSMRERKDEIRQKSKAQMPSRTLGLKAQTNGSLIRPPGWNDDDEFQAKCVRSLAKDAARVLPVFLGTHLLKAQTAAKLGGKGSTQHRNSSKNINKSDDGGRSKFLFIADDLSVDSVLGLETAIRALHEAVLLPLLYPDALKKMNIIAPRGVLLYGSPGTGKTLAVRVIATTAARICDRMSKRDGREHKIAFYHRTAADCLGKFHGQAERTLRLLFASAIENAPSIIFIDEIDGLLPTRAGGNSNVSQDHLHTSVVTTMLALMDDMKDRGNVVVIGATNRPESIDPALRRPGRFDREVYCPLPSAKDRENIISLYTKEWNPAPHPMIVRAAAKATQGYAGADLKSLCSCVMMMALHRTKPNFMQELLEEETLNCMLNERRAEHSTCNVEATKFKESEEVRKNFVNVMSCDANKDDENGNTRLEKDHDNNNETFKQDVGETDIERPVDSNVEETIGHPPEIPSKPSERLTSSVEKSDMVEDHMQSKVATFLSNLHLHIQTQPSDWRTGIRMLPPPCIKRATSAATAMDSIGPLPYEVAHILLPGLQILLKQLYNNDVSNSLSAKDNNSSIKAILEIFETGSTTSEIERNLCKLGVLCSPAWFVNSELKEKKTFVQNPVRMYDSSSACTTLNLRIMIGGRDDSGQKQLAGCLLDIFSNERIQPINLPLLLAEGEGNIFDGMVKVLENTLTFGTSLLVLFLPQLDLWVEEDSDEDPCRTSNLDDSSNEHALCEPKVAPMSSKAWSIFQQQIESLSHHRSLVIVATSCTQLNTLNSSVRDFFNMSHSNEISCDQRANTASVEIAPLTSEQIIEFVRRSSKQLVDRLLLSWIENNKCKITNTRDNELSTGGGKVGNNSHLLIGDSLRPRTRVTDKENSSVKIDFPSSDSLKMSTEFIQISNSLKAIGHKLLRDERVRSLDDHIMTTEMDFSKSLRFVAQRAVSGHFGTNIPEMTRALHFAAAAHHSIAMRWMKRYKYDGDDEMVAALMAADGAKAAADDYSSRLFDLEKKLSYIKEDNRKSASVDQSRNADAVDNQELADQISLCISSLTEAQQLDVKLCETVLKQKRVILQQLEPVSVCDSLSLGQIQDRVNNFLLKRCGESSSENREIEISLRQILSVVQSLEKLLSYNLETEFHTRFADIFTGI